MKKREPSSRVLCSENGVLLVASFKEFISGRVMQTESVMLLNLHAGHVVVTEIRAKWVHENVEQHAALPVFHVLAPGAQRKILFHESISELWEAGLDEGASGLMDRRPDLTLLQVSVITPHGEAILEAKLWLERQRMDDQTHFLDAPWP